MRNAPTDWLRLDNAAKIYPATHTEEWSAVFRVSVTLTHEIDPLILDQSIAASLRRFPSLYVQMRRGLFWYFLDKPPQSLQVRAMRESEPPCRPLRDAEGVVFRVLYYGKRISVEFFHVLTDGLGALTYLKALTADYLTRMGLLDKPQEGILSLNEDPMPREWEDSFLRYADPHAKGSWAETPAWQAPGQPLCDGALTQCLMSVAELKMAAKANGVTITEYLGGLILYALHSHCTDNRPVKLSVPVNLRKFFPSKTLRNFSSYVNVMLNENAENMADVCAEVRRQLREQATKETLRHRMSLNVNSERNVLIRLAPLTVKNMALRAAFVLYGERLFTSTLSNLGGVVLPDDMAAHVEYFDMVIGMPHQNAHTFGAVSFRDTFVLSVTRRIAESWLERDIVGLLRHDGVGVQLISNGS
ncbi:MAG: hypothetical protein FWE06_04445 [Oscillospiraceae bacterium]|nr:hypothetical protein [Oscillospiraceae bacterium]